MEKSVRTASERSWEKLSGIAESHYVSAVKGESHCEQAILDLQGGDKKVFKSNGEFKMALPPLHFWVQMWFKIEDGENGIDVEHTPYWKEVEQSTMRLKEAWSECGPFVLQGDKPELPARLFFGEWLKNHLSQTIFPDDLPEVPNPQINTIVLTGENIPCSGIWEPVDLHKPGKAILSLLPSKPPSGFIAPIGCMNYLHEESPAPTAKIAKPDGVTECATAWRLLWRDDRYRNAEPPLEERDYRFSMPQEKLLPANKSSAPGDDVIWEISGRSAPVTGKWLVETDLNTSVTLQQGELLPLHQGREVRWVLAD